jgi:hypothetical protein
MGACDSKNSNSKSSKSSNYHALTRRHNSTTDLIKRRHGKNLRMSFMLIIGDNMSTEGEELDLNVEKTSMIHKKGPSQLFCKKKETPARISFQPQEKHISPSPNLSQSQTTKEISLSIDQFIAEIKRLFLLVQVQKIILRRILLK